MLLSDLRTELVIEGRCLAGVYMLTAESEPHAALQGPDRRVTL
jgi:hypothetical protein